MVNSVDHLNFRRIVSTLISLDVDKEYFSTFMTKSTNVEKVDYVYDLLKENHLLTNLIINTKDDDISHQHQEKGLILYGIKSYRAALERFTSSLCTAQSQNILARGYKLRSDCLYMLNWHQECLQDIERALAIGCPENLQSDLKSRKEAIVNSAKRSPKPYEDIPEIPNSDRNTLIQCASSAVKLQISSEFGKSVVAARDIKIGEVLSVEKPFAAILSKEQLIYCAECLELCYNPIPCEKCTQVAYCGEICKNGAFKKYHRYECPLMVSLQILQIEDPKWLALRIAILAKKEYAKLNGYTKIEETEPYRSDRFKELHDLDPKTKERKPIDLFCRAAFTALLFHLLKQTTFFNGSQRSKIEQYFKHVLFLQLQVCSLGVVFEIEGLVKDSKGFDMKNYGSSIYSFASTLRHSCCNNVLRVNYGSAIVLRANNSIKKGESCCLTYGPHYMSYPTSTRLTLLKEIFYIDCKCKACTHNWSESLESIISRMSHGLRATEMDNGNVTAAAKHIQQLIEELQRCEKYEPSGKALAVKFLLQKAFRVFGNIRR